MKPRILIVDDDEVFCGILSGALQNRNYTCQVAYNFKQAQMCVQSQKPSYAVVDLRLGNDSGLKVCQMLLAEAPDIHIVILTGFASIATAVTAIKLGVIQYITKPTDVDTILSALEQEDANIETKIPNRPLPVKRLEWEHLQKVLTANNGNISQAARQLGMHRRTLQRKLQKKPVKESNDH